MRISRRPLACLAAGFLGGISFLNANAAESPYARLESLDKRFDALIAPDTKIEKIADDLKWSEGPLWDAKTKSLLFSDIPRNVIMQWNADKGVSTFLERSGYTGAAPFTGLRTRLQWPHVRPAGTTDAVPARRPAHLAARSRRHHGSRWPWASTARSSTARTTWCSTTRATSISPIRRSAFPSNSRIPARSCRSTGCSASRRTATITAVATELEAPNGLGFSPDYKTLYVANARASSPIWKAYAVQADGSLDKGRVFADSAALYKKGDGVPDGLKVDVHGNVFATGPGGVLVYSPDGTLLGRILTGVPTANVAFGEDGSTLFITANHRVLRMRTLTKRHAAAGRPINFNSTKGNS